MPLPATTLRSGPGSINGVLVTESYHCNTRLVLFVWQLFRIGRVQEGDSSKNRLGVDLDHKCGLNNVNIVRMGRSRDSGKFVAFFAEGSYEASEWLTGAIIPLLISSVIVLVFLSCQEVACMATAC